MTAEADAEPAAPAAPAAEVDAGSTATEVRDPAPPPKPPGPRRWRGGGAALLLFLGASFLLFGLRVAGHPFGTYVGDGSGDPAISMWMLGWWPHALAHGIDPLQSTAVWAPDGINLAWTTSIPGPAVALWPVTGWLGPVFAYNLAIVAAPALSAWAAFLLCRAVTGRFWPSIVGGYLFGFSTYQLAHLNEHLNLVLMPFPPLAVLLVWRRVRGEIGDIRFAALLALVLIGQFLTSTEILATMTVIGVAALAVAFLVLRGERQRLWRTARLIPLAYAVTAAVVSPFIVALATSPEPMKSYDIQTGSVDLGGLFLPTRIQVGSGLTDDVAHRVSHLARGNTEYVGIVLVAILVALAIRGWRTPAGRLLTLSGALALLAALGPSLTVAGHRLVPLPWRLAEHLPLLGRALPIRFMAYVWLIAGVAIACWLARSRRPWPWILAGIALVMLVPNPWGPWKAEVTTPAPLSDATLQRTLGPDAVVLVIARSPGEALLGQARSWLAYRMPVARLGLTPPGEPPGITARLTTASPPGISPERFGDLLLAHEVDAVVVVDSGNSEAWTAYLERLGFAGKHLDSIELFRLTTPKT